MYGRGGVGGTAVPCPLRRPYVFVRPRLPSVGYLSLVTAPSPPTQRPPLPGLRLPLGRRRLGTGALVSMVVHGLIIVLLIARGRELLQRLPGAPGQGGGGNGRRRRLHFRRLAAHGDSAAAGAGSRLRGRSHLRREVLGGGRRARHAGRDRPADRRRGLQPGVPAAHDGVPVLPGPHAGRAERGERRTGPPANR